MTQQSAHYLRRDDAASYIRQKHKINCTSGYLAKLASVGGGPLFYKVGCRVEYDPVHLDTWALARISGPLQKATEKSSTEEA
jgi:hypothetical protein